MMMWNMWCCLALLGLLLRPTVAIDKDVNPGLVAKLEMANTELDRMKTLSSDSDWLFDFTTQPKYSWQPGGVVNADRATWPTVTGNGLTMAYLNLGPCAMLPVHIHPRASNYVTAINGTTRTYMLEENGAPLITEVLTHGKLTIFPQGSIHTMMNIGCDNAQLVSVLSSEDPGTTNLVNSMAMFDFNMIHAAGIGTFEKNIPPIGTGAVSGPAECIQRCQKKGRTIKRAEMVAW